MLIQFSPILGMVIYVLLLIMAEIIAPITVFPLLPVAVILWGSFATALLSIAGWTIGAFLAFALARIFGKPFVKKVSVLEKIESLGRVIPEHHIFFATLLLRTVLPVDILSYALGLFTRIGWGTYTLATFLGIIPFAFIFSYGVVLPFRYQALLAIAAIVVVLLSYKKIKALTINRF